MHTKLELEPEISKKAAPATLLLGLYYGLGLVCSSYADHSLVGLYYGRVQYSYVLVLISLW